MKSPPLLALIFLLTACTQTKSVGFASKPNCGWNSDTIAMAKKTWLYAQLASNVYSEEADEPQDFRLGDDIVLLDPQDNDEIGLAYSVYERRGPAGPIELIIAFRGTEGFLGKEGRKDWQYGNLTMAQQRSGLDVYDDWRNRPEASGIPISVTGHSLGGSISIQISLCRGNVDTYVFNSSPRFRDCHKAIESNRYSVVEHGEVLKLARIFGREASQQYNSIGCIRRVNPVRQHQMRHLAECLTRIAAVAGKDGGAIASLERNPEVPRNCWPGRRPNATSRFRTRAWP